MSGACKEAQQVLSVNSLSILVHARKQQNHSKTGRVKPVRTTDILEDLTRLSQGSVGSNSESIVGITC